MKRRDVFAALGGAFAAPMLASVGAGAQPAMPVIGFLHSGSPGPNAARVAGFRKGLLDAGLIEGQNVAIEFRWASGESARLPEMAADLVRRQVSAIVTPSDTSAALAAKAATATIPVVFAVGGDPVHIGLVPSLNRPGGNVTGISILQVELTPKRFELLREVASHATGYSALVNPNNRLTPGLLKQIERAQSALGIEVEILRASTDTEIDDAFAAIARKQGRALLLGTDTFFFIRRAKIAALAAQHKVAAVYDNRAFVEVGGLISYGPDAVHIFAQVAAYVGRILKGEKPADLPVQQSDKFETAINQKAAKTLGFEIPPKLLFTADHVIE
jgi:putative ABC transport system substrate-binding protein